MDLAVNKAIKTVIENTIIPELEAKLQKYKTLRKKSMHMMKNLANINQDICYKCTEFNDIVYYCRICYFTLCEKCIVAKTINICNECHSFVHKKCINGDVNKTDLCKHDMCYD